MMKKLSLLFLLCGVGLVCRSQQLIASAGGTSNHGGTTVSWSFGESITAIATQGSLGFQQNYKSIVIGIEEFESLPNSLFPNPAKDFIRIQLETKQGQSFALTVFNLSGSIVLQKKIETTTHSIELDISNLASGPYEIFLASPHARVITMSFIKL